MGKDKEKAVYESPYMRRTQVNLESGICASSADVENSSDSDTGTIEGHEVNKDFGSGGWTSEGWD